MLNRDKSIRKKLMNAILLTCFVVSMVIYAAFFAYEYISFRQSLERELTSLGEIIAANSSAALAFRDEDSAGEILGALKSRPNIVAAALYDKEGNLFSKYPSEVSEDDIPLSPYKMGYYFSDSHLSGFQPVMQGNQNHGVLYLRSDMRAMQQRLRPYGLIAFLVMVITLLLAYVLSKQLQKRISDPILALANTASTVSVYQDYSVRAEKMGEDEVGFLTDAFNNMLSQIEKKNEDIRSFNQKLKQSQQELQNIMDHSLDVICTMDENGRFIKVSEASKKVWGYEPKELTGKKTSELVYEEDLSGFEQSGAEKRSGWEATNFENRFITKDGSIVPLIWSARWDPNEKIMYCVAKDATQLKDAENRLQQHAKELAASNEELEQFAYIASHDLQEPLRMVTSFLTQLEKKYKGQLDDKAQQYIHFAVDGAVRMRRIILDLLEYSRVGKNSEFDIVDLNEILREIEHFNRTIIADKGASIIWQNLPVIHGARTPLQQLFQNLISNALKYQKKDVKPVVKIGYKEFSRHWQFEVSDNGIGIDPQFFDKIFLAFQRLHNNTEYSGSGIGLAICKKIVEAHGGDLWVESTPGEGSTFILPLLKTLIILECLCTNKSVHTYIQENINLYRMNLFIQEIKT